MKRPWQIWTVFGVALAVACGIMAWLTFKTVALDRAEAAARSELDLARRQAELDDRISQALWRMDTALAPLIAAEAVRPVAVYEPILAVERTKGTKGDVKPTVSPIVEQPSPFVLLHFQVGPKGSLTSPQSPVGFACSMAVEAGCSPDNIKLSANRLDELRKTIDPDNLIARLPNESLPANDKLQAQWSLNPNVPIGDNSAYVLNRDLNAYEQTGIQQEIGPLPEAPNSNDALPDGEERQTAQAADPQPNAPPQQQQATAQVREPTQSPGQQALRQGNSSLNDLTSRGRSFQNYAQQADAQQRKQSAGNAILATGNDAIAGVSRPLWIGDQLILARRVTQRGELLVQGVWLDWPALKDWLTKSTADLLPEMLLAPATANTDAASHRLLATVPVELIVPPLAVEAASIATLGLPLVVAWSSLVLAALAVAALLFGVVRLSERRAAFVSAVTHELRTPLTTFRLYTDMLSQGLVTDEARRGEYINTLHAEADRLGHLVENVLSFARLERKNQMRRCETTTIGRLLDDAAERLQSRAAQSGLIVEVEAGATTRGAAVVVDPAAVEQILFNLVDNACKYAAASTDRRLKLAASVEGRCAAIRLRDFGPGIPPNRAREVFRPFSRPADNAHPNIPGVGLGLALCRRLARSMKGELELHRRSDGAEFELRLPLA
jgi:signal transduction histidine kinase